MESDDWAVGVDLGGTKVEVGRVDRDGRIVQRVRRRTDVEGGAEAVVEEIASAARDLCSGADGSPAGFGVGVAGQVDSDGGVVRFAPNLRWEDVPLGRMLGDALGLSVAVTNDVRAATWGEWLHGAGRRCDHVVCIFVGTGVGGGVVSHGRVLEGHTNAAGELGHMTVALGGPECTCGSRGCLEALAGGWAIARQARAAVERDPEAGRVLADIAGGGEITAEHVARGFHAGDPLAVRLVESASDALIAGAVSVVNAFNPARLVLGGGVIEGLPGLVHRVAEGVRERALRVAADSLEVLPSGLHGDAGVVGAAAFARSVSEHRGP